MYQDSESKYLDEGHERFSLDLCSLEFIWRDSYYFLQHRGYQLRPRYEPGWVGSWLTNGKDTLECEDSLHSIKVVDAIRISDGVKVALKCVETSNEEIPIGLYFSSAALHSNTKNHCVQILDVIPIPSDDDLAFIVMPILRIFDNPTFRRKSECIEAFHQMLEGLEFIHEHNIAHRDACFFNFMMDASRLIPEGFHHAATSTYDGVKRITHYKTRKSVRPVNYYWIDFGLSTAFHPLDKAHLVYGKVGQEKNVPEMSRNAPYDAFKADIFQVGMTMKRLYDKYDGLQFLRPFIGRLLQEDPQKRPSASEALLEFQNIVKNLRPGKLNGFVTHYLVYDKSEKRSRLRRKKLSAWKRRKLDILFNRVRNESEKSSSEHRQSA